MTTTTCPCCGGTLRKAGVRLAMLDQLPLTGTERLIVSHLVTRYPLGVSKQALFDDLYGLDPDGGPESGVNVISVFVCHLRRKLNQYGWDIPRNGSGSGNMGFYRLAPIGGAA